MATYHLISFMKFCQDWNDKSDNKWRLALELYRLVNSSKIPIAQWDNRIAEKKPIQFQKKNSSRFSLSALFNWLVVQFIRWQLFFNVGICYWVSDTDALASDYKFPYPVVLKTTVWGFNNFKCATCLQQSCYFYFLPITKKRFAYFLLHIFQDS